MKQSTPHTSIETKKLLLYFSYVCFALVLFFLLHSDIYAVTAVPQKPPNNLGLQGYWSFNEGDGTIVSDASGNVDHGSLTNMESTDWSDGRKGKALDFDGVDEYVQLASGVLAISDDPAFAMCAWVKTDSVSVAQAVVATGNSSEAFGVAALFINNNGNGSVSLEFGDSNTATTVGGVIRAGEWYHICGVKTPGAINTTSTIYVNGASVAIPTASSGTPAIYTSYGIIGQFIFDGSYFDGKIDEVRVYNRALSASDVSALYNSKVARLATSRNQYVTDGLIALYSFDGPDVSSNTVYDRSGQENDATVTSGFSITNTPYPGQIGQSYYFTGSTEVLSYSNSSITGADSRTMSIWTHQDTIIDSTAMSLGVVSSGELFAILCYGGDWYFNGWSADFDTDVPCTIGEWHHNLVTYDGTTVAYYLDGVNIGSSDIVLNTTAAPVKVGTSSGGVADWQGGLDDARVYNRVLSQPEITRLYRIGKSNLVQ